MEFYKLKMSSYRNNTKGWMESEIIPRRLEFPNMGRVAEAITELMGRDLGKSITVRDF